MSLLEYNGQLMPVKQSHVQEARLDRSFKIVYRGRNV